MSDQRDQPLILAASGECASMLSGRVLGGKAELAKPRGQSRILA